MRCRYLLDTGTAQDYCLHAAAWVVVSKDADLRAIPGITVEN